MEKTKEPFLRLSHRKFLLLLLFGGAAGLCAVLFYACYAERTLAEAVAATARDRLVLYSGTLHSALSKYGYLPHILAGHPVIRASLAGDDKAAAIDAANRYLEEVNAASGSMELLVLDKNGLCIAASNWNSPESFVGHDYSYRPYYRDALRDGRGKYYGVGTTTNKAGFFFAERITADGNALGVAVTKVSLAMLQREWRDGGETVFMTDAHGIIFLSSRDDWRYRATLPLDKDAVAAIFHQRQYGQLVSPDVGVRFEGKNGVDSMIIDGQAWLYTARPLPEYGWTIWFLSPLTTLEREWESSGLIGLGIVCVLLLLLVLVRVLSAWSKAKRVAQEAEKIRSVNRRLAKEIRIRKKTEQALLAAQDDLLHAGRMTALGQVAASLAHELSQPVTSMSMFASSCRKFADEGRHDKVAETLAHIQDMVLRIKSLIEQLKLFSRKSPCDLSPVSVATALRNALAVLHHKQEATNCAPVIFMPQDVLVMADALQVEQALINLILNALDAVSAVPEEERLVSVTVTTTADTVFISIADSGPGIDPSVVDKIFTPFFTTKNSGQGIGLGLAIVDNIAHSLHGSISVTSREPRGASFTLSLPRAGGDRNEA